MTDTSKYTMASLDDDSLARVVNFHLRGILAIAEDSIAKVQTADDAVNAITLLTSGLDEARKVAVMLRDRNPLLDVRIDSTEALEIVNID